MEIEEYLIREASAIEDKVVQDYISEAGSFREFVDILMKHHPNALIRLLNAWKTRVKDPSLEPLCDELIEMVRVLRDLQQAIWEEEGRESDL